MTVNKAQGQSLKFVGVDLHARPCFNHGQLYVALSRVTNMRNLWVIGERSEDIPRRELVNIVYQEILLNRRALWDDEFNDQDMLHAEEPGGEPFYESR